MNLSVSGLDPHQTLFYSWVAVGMKAGVGVGVRVRVGFGFGIGVGVGIEVGGGVGVGIEARVWCSGRNTAPTRLWLPPTPHLLGLNGHRVRVRIRVRVRVRVADGDGDGDGVWDPALTQFQAGVATAQV